MIGGSFEFKLVGRLVSVFEFVLALVEEETREGRVGCSGGGHAAAGRRVEVGRIVMKTPAELGVK